MEKINIMNKKYISVVLLVLGVLIFSVAISEEDKHQTKPAPEVLNTFKALEGEWVGTHTNHKGEEEQVTIIYRTVSAGTAVEERIFADTPKEMITVYHGTGDDGILMTHYCALGNQPRMQLKNTDGKSFKFQFLDGVNIDRETTGHMGGMTLTVVDEDTIEHEWDYYEGGEVKDSGSFTFTKK